LGEFCKQQSGKTELQSRLESLFRCFIFQMVQPDRPFASLPSGMIIDLASRPEASRGPIRIPGVSLPLDLQGKAMTIEKGWMG
jgi:hypothetical protein